MQILYNLIDFFKFPEDSNCVVLTDLLGKMWYEEILWSSKSPFYHADIYPSWLYLIGNKYKKFQYSLPPC